MHPHGLTHAVGVATRNGHAQPCQTGVFSLITIGWCQQEHRSNWPKSWPNPSVDPTWVLTLPRSWPNPNVDPTEPLTRSVNQSYHSIDRWSVGPINQSGELFKPVLIGWIRAYTPRFSTTRKGPSDVRLGRSWYRHTRVEILYIVVHLFYMFEAFTDVKICIEPHIRVFLGYFCVFSCISLWFRKYIWKLT